ncbi:MAG: Glutamine-dependent NAD(+) synthetase [Anaerolineales bacterium]|nr:Glutamine-dependent NAD(+) synthetase [Anaerolineales bacterium]
MTGNDMKLAIAQINTTVGDLEGNISRILDAAKKAKDADLIVFPEMTIPGYPPRDMLYDTSFVEAVQTATLDLSRRTGHLPPLLVGSFAPSGERHYQHPSLHNVAYLMKGGEMRVAQIKQLLPVYDVFFEPRWFVPGRKTMPPIEIAGRKIGVMLCEDMWDEEYPTHPGAELKAMGAEMLVVMSASPFRKGIGEGRLYHAKRQDLPLVFVNLVGATDELIFDGGSFVLNRDRLRRFEEEARVLTMDDGWQAMSHVPSSIAAEEDLFRALVLGVRDFARKNGMKKAYLGLSGGIDSSVTAVIAAEALGAENVTGVAIPSRFTDSRSTESARELARNLGIKFESLPLEKMHEAAEQALGAERSGGVSGENIQARLRMIVLMSYVNSGGGFLINTSNKTELTLGYSTLYGDMAGAISPLGDVTKAEVMGLARWINLGLNVGRLKVEGLIPAFVVARKPTAELREGQADPFDYEVVSPQMEEMVLADQANAMMRAGEHKRWQMGVVLKVSGRSFGRGRMFPITRR